MGLGVDEEKDSTYFNPVNVPFFARLNRIGLQPFLMRVSATIGAGLGIYCSQEGLQNILALLAVGSGLSKVDVWGPRFGSMGEAFSLRGF